MPYSEEDHSKPVATILSLASRLQSDLAKVFFMLYPNMHLPQVDLHGKIAIVTGANSGVGFESARALAGMGARVVLACRNESKGQEARQRIVADTGNDAVELEILDCGSFASVRDFLDRWEKREHKKVDILINNAGALTNVLAITSDGLEQTYQSNHLSHVLLTHTLLNRNCMSSDARIVSVSSCGSYDSTPLDTHNANGADILSKYQNRTGTSFTFGHMMQLYARSKAAQMIWTIVLQRRLSQTERWKNISVHSCHPGMVKSSIWSQPAGIGSLVSRSGDLFKAFATTGGITNAQGAVTPVWLATDQTPAKVELRGMYWDRQKWMWIMPWSLEPARQEQLWNKWCEDAQAPLVD